MQKYIYITIQIHIKKGSILLRFYSKSKYAGWDCNDRDLGALTTACDREFWISRRWVI